ncbi:hypothetical protein [Marinomonas ostreistagni]|uniref:hypothetical protein n=1 Tax=Marinomonas ostreistagni TaxID=359209 RepID=UPI0019524E5F|nr:hypothetical protein [Marinomonas ostreistagni]MBM6552218.1 hypothetical protein [Marinomonas ostreistagni]
MSDVLSDVNMYLSEPDETVLTAALRNKDDIPILMDIVGDDTPLVSQEEHLQSSVTIDPEVRPVTAKAVSAKKDTMLKRPVVPTTTATPTISTEQAAFHAAKRALEQPQTAADSTDQAAPTEAHSESAAQASPSSNLLSEVIQTVLERKLPEIVEEVMLEIAKREQR